MILNKYSLFHEKKEISGKNSYDTKLFSY